MAARLAAHKEELARSVQEKNSRLQQKIADLR
jgi:hypothetical protein